MDFTPHTDPEIAEMLRVIGVSSIDDLFQEVPEVARILRGLDLPAGLSEAEVEERVRGLADRNPMGAVVSFLGAGAYDHYIPAAVDHLVSRGEFLTSYTPYQAEVSQGTLQAQFEYQTMVAGLLGMDVANASMYEGATACAEAALMCQRHTRRRRVLVSRAVHPQYRDVLKTYLGPEAIQEIPWDARGSTDLAALQAALGPEVGGVVLQSPNFFGVIEDLAPVAHLVHEAGALLVATFTEALAFGLVEAPGVQGADLAAGEGQSLGIPLSFGGPYVGFFAVKQPFVKGMPGRLIGMTRDARGNRCFTLTLAAREQHIRRERASSNICTNEGLCALRVAIHLSLLGREGFRRLARYNHHRAVVVERRLAAIPGVEAAFDGPIFNEFVLRVPGRAAALVEEGTKRGLVPGLALGRFHQDLADCLLVTVTERRGDGDIDRLEVLFREVLASREQLP
ncbi:aminomethyl-transferring glycine dehydrogenase subunit GcvPA [Myxococcota bacterium]|nr:aminomethyl-transferring glycine dehydrogenase subunit GcvPA [Myxococcota bacterium]